MILQLVFLHQTNSYGRVLPVVWYRPVISSGVSDFNLVLAQDYMPAVLSCQAQSLEPDLRAAPSTVWKAPWLPTLKV